MLTVGERLVAEDQVEAVSADTFPTQQFIKNFRHPADKGFTVKPNLFIVKDPRAVVPVDV
jgi:hypothetical protein